MVTYDVRGAGESPEPPDTGDYSPYLALDPAGSNGYGQPGISRYISSRTTGVSIQSWEAVTDPALQTRIASFTSNFRALSDHMGTWLRNRLTRPFAGRLAPTDEAGIALVVHLPVSFAGSRSTLATGVGPLCGQRY